MSAPSESAPVSRMLEKVAELVRRFRSHRDRYLASDYNEANVRLEFIDPLLESLGWDVQNKGGAAEQYKPVKVEDSLRIDGKSRAPDYSLRIGGIRKIVVEAKKPGVNLKENAEAARQLRRYAWSAEAPVGILTDFEEFAVYDCRERPGATHSAARARIHYLTWEEYEGKWEWLQTHFSPAGITRGCLDRLAADIGARRGVESVGDAFLGEMEKFRDILAREIALRNRELSERELNHAVRLTLDRIIFLRVCEDRGVEKYGQLREAARKDVKDVYAEMLKLFHAADRRYNSGLFYLRRETGRGKPDALSLRLKINDRPLRDIVSALYPPESPYDFSVVGADILGQAYERFLGKEIRLTNGHSARVEEKPEVRKQGGVYYTPGWVVRHIVNRALGESLRGAAPARKFRVLDPACGSGSFLLGAYEFLLDWHLDKYREDPKLHLKAGQIVKDDSGEFRLSLNERRSILTSNLWGVDKDEQAVEVAKLSLMLKCLEGENAGSIGAARELGMRALPDLGKNIRAGNSIIAPDFHHGLNPDEKEILQINAFDWPREFPEIIGKDGGFDAVIGNPPYVRQESLGNGFKEYAQERYEVFHGTADLFSYFIERGISLLKPGGRFSYIVSSKWMRANYGEPLRNFLRERELLEIVDFGDQQVFPGAATYTCILTAGGGKARANFQAARMEKLPGIGDDFSDMVNERTHKISRSSLGASGWSLARADAAGLLEKLQSENIPLVDFVGKIYRGVITGLNKAFVIDDAEREKLIRLDPKSAELIKPFVVGADVKRYAILPDGKWLICIPRGFTNEKHGKSGPRAFMEAEYPAIMGHLREWEKELKKRDDQGDYWWELRACRYYPAFGKPKIVYPDISALPNFTLDGDGFFCGNTAYFMPLSDMALLAVLNSSLSSFYFKHTGSPARGGYLRFFQQYLKPFPIPRGFSAATKMRSELSGLSAAALRATSEMGKTSDSHILESRSRMLAEINAKIDERVFKLYNLSSAEAKIITG